MRKFLVLIIFVFCLGLFGQTDIVNRNNIIREFTSENQIKGMFEKIQKSKSYADYEITFKVLSTLKLRESDVEYIVKEVQEIAQDSQKESLLNLFLNIDSTDVHLENKFIDLLENDDVEIRIISIKNLSVLKSKKSVPKIRGIVKDYSDFKFNALSYINKNKAKKKLIEASISAKLLGELKDQASIPILLDKFYEMQGSVGLALASMGKIAIKDIIELVRKEIEDSDNDGEARQCLYAVDDPACKPDLLKIYYDKNENVYLRSMVLDMLLSIYRDEDIKKNLQDNYMQLSYTDKLTLISSLGYEENDFSFLKWIIDNEKKISTVTYSMSRLSMIRNQAVVNELEILLKHKNKDVRQNAYFELLKITGKEYEWEK